MNGSGEIKITIRFKPGDQGYEEVLKVPARYRAWEIKKAFQGVPSAPVGVREKAVTQTSLEVKKRDALVDRLPDF